MPDIVAARPSVEDYAPYFARYVTLVPDGDLVEILRSQEHTLSRLLERVDPAREAYRYALEKWSVREVVGHLIDTERVFSYRATQFSRGDMRPLPSFDQDAWLPFGEYDARSLRELLDEWRAARANTLALLRHMPAPALRRRGIASDMEFTVLALLSIIAGHVEYHLARLPADYRAAFA